MAEADPNIRLQSLLSYVRTGGQDLTNRQTAILMLVCWSPGQHTVRGLASSLNVGKPIITRAVNTLSGLGLVRRRRDPHDGRNVFIVGTAKGRHLLSRIPHG